VIVGQSWSITRNKVTSESNNYDSTTNSFNHFSITGAFRFAHAMLFSIFSNAPCLARAPAPPSGYFAKKFFT